MCILLTPVLYFLTTVIIEVYSQCFTESVSLRDIGKPTSRAEISSPSSSWLKAVKGAHIGSALTGATSELTNSNRKKNSHKTPFSLFRKKFRTRLHSFLLFIYLKLKKKRNTNPIKTKILVYINKKNKMDHHTDQPSSNIPTHSHELQLATLTQQNRRLTREILHFKVKQYHLQDELNILLNTAEQLKYHYFAVEQQPFSLYQKRHHRFHEPPFFHS